MTADAGLVRRGQKGTAEMLVRAASREFNEHGFLGTDTNRIARCAGFAPQTFYRWFHDKTEIFIKVYERWQHDEARMLQGLLAKDADDTRLVRAVVRHHRAYRVFRRSLRQLSVEDDDVRKARANGRLNQIRQIRNWIPEQQETTADLAVALLQFERLADGLAEGQLRDMGLEGKPAETALASIIRRFRALP